MTTNVQAIPGLKVAEYARRGNVMIFLQHGTVEPYKSINAAKRASRKVQGKDLGRGTVRCIPYKVDRSYMLSERRKAL